MKYLVIMCIFVFYSTAAHADIFVRSENPDEQLIKAVAQDSRGFYYKEGIDYDANAVPISSAAQAMNKMIVSKGQNRFDFQNNLASVINAQLDSSDFNGVKNIPAGSRLMLLQYASPAEADLLKHFNTIAHLKLALRYGQYEDLERAEADPMNALRKASEMACLRGQGKNNLNTAMAVCKAESPFAHLRIPGTKDLIGGGFFTIQEILRQLGVPKEDIEWIIKSVGDVKITKTTYQLKPPQQQIRHVMADNRKNYLDQLSQLLEEFKTNKTVSQDELDKMSLPGVPLIEAQVRNIAMLDEGERYLAMARLASALAYVKTMDQYADMRRLLDRAREYPGIQNIYKPILQEHSRLAASEMAELESEKERLIQYADTMSFILDAADAERLNAIAETDRITGQNDTRKKTSWMGQGI